MATRTRITADFPTPSEVVSRLRIPASRVAELRRQIDLIAIPEAKPRRTDAAGDSSRTDDQKMAQRIKREYSNDLFDTGPFADLAYVANDAAYRHIPSLTA